MRLLVDGTASYAYTGTRALVHGQPSIVLLHGGEQDHSVWTMHARWFAHHGWNALAPDLPGHGRSAGAPLASIGDMADWTMRLLDALALETAALVGHSMGSLIALDAAARHPQRVRAIALVGCTVPMPVSDELLAAARGDLAQARRLMVRWSHSEHAKLAPNPVPGLWLTGMARALTNRAAPGVLATDLAACHRYAAGLERAAAVRCPALLVSGSRDRMTPVRAAGALQQALSGMQTVTLAGAGHAVMQEQPDALLDALARFLSPLARERAVPG